MMATLQDPDSHELLSLELKKKKKTRKKVDMSRLDAQVAEIAAATVIPQSNSVQNSVSTTNTTATEATGKDIALDEELDLTNVRKKRKKKVLKIDDTGDAVKALVTEQSLEPPSVIQSALPAVAEKPSETIGVTYDYVLPLKKRRKRNNITFEGFSEALAEEGVEVAKDDVIEGDEDMEIMDTSSWAGTDRDYTYDELLERVFNIMRQKNPSMVDRKTKLVMKPPQVMRVGARRTSFANFTEICKLLHRQPKHLLAFLLAELGTNGSIDGNNQLIIKGRFQQKQIETVLRRYIKEYVTCHTCRSPDTNLQRENRLFFLQCGTCGSRCTVENVKSGFQAVTNRRAIRQQQ